MVSLLQGSLGFLTAQYPPSKRTRLNVLIQPLLVRLANAPLAEARQVANPRVSPKRGCKRGWRQKAWLIRAPMTALWLLMVHSPPTGKVHLPLPTTKYHFVMGPELGLKCRRDRATQALCVVPGCRALWAWDKLLHTPPPQHTMVTQGGITALDMPFRNGRGRWVSLPEPP